MQKSSALKSYSKMEESRTSETSMMPLQRFLVDTAKAMRSIDSLIGKCLYYLAICRCNIRAGTGNPLQAALSISTNRLCARCIALIHQIQHLEECSTTLFIKIAYAEACQTARNFVNSQRSQENPR